MPLNFNDQKKKQKQLVIVVIFIAIAIGVILWLGYFSDIKISNLFSSNEEIPELPANNILRVSIDFSIFENSLLKELQPFFQIPLYEGKVGRVNPFAGWQASKTK